MLPVLSRTIISSFQTAGHNSPALSMDPFGLHLAGLGSPAFPVGCCESWRGSDNIINMASLSKDMQTDENGGNYLNTKKWKLLEINRKSDERGRIHVNEINYGKEIKVFVSDIDVEIEMCKNYYLIPDSIFTEIRKSRVKAQTGEPLNVQKSGDVWMGYGNKNKFVKVFVRIDKE